MSCSSDGSTSRERSELIDAQYGDGATQACTVHSAPRAKRTISQTQHSIAAAKGQLGWRRTLSLVLAGGMSRGEPKNASIF